MEFESADDSINPTATLTHALHLEQKFLAQRRRQIVIHESNSDSPVAIAQLISPGNKSDLKAVEELVDRAIGALKRKLHLQIIDLFPPGRWDPNGLHHIIWQGLNGVIEDREVLADRPLTLAAYSAGDRYNCYVEPTAVGLPRVELPLFLTPERYVNVPLEGTYMAAYEGVPRRFKQVIEAG